MSAALRSGPDAPPLLPAGPDDPRWRSLPRCGSTNDEAARLARAGAPEGTVVLAAEQEQGRGRLGHSWYSPPGENLYLSLLLRPPLPPSRAPLLTLLCGVALCEVVTAEVGDRGAAELKWPNDLLLSCGGGPPRKVAGVLTEMVTSGARLDFVVVGIGVNLGSRAFPEELADRATSLALCTGRAVAPADFAARLLPVLGRQYAEYLAEGPAPLLRRFSAHAAFLRRGEPIAVRGAGSDLAGVPVGLDAEGALLLRDAAGAVHRVIAGELALPGEAAR